ncbi:uncharacterized protein N7458_009020 [Penicillium daleae]|uniref:NACHT-NTPase and P-loop NTPases N-terminal domain-containing protein n=1 Tax=Penicillium daleae TaxID=63821 RepID=A0AAD6BXV3_9EURO|nr:uncharacterized protein N7458_009020 [Penicillium daleae]KAJ5438022.1 hypothetical protein N7458_009020 [Penicillium daleae]
MSGLEVIGAISAVISIIDASVKVYDSARKDLKLPETFDTVGRRLPIILDTLNTCKSNLEPSKDTMSEDVCQALGKIIDVCDEKARKLREIFEKTMPGEKDTWEKRYSKVVRRLGKGNKVEDLMIAITQDVQLIVNQHAVNSATPEQKAELEEIIEEMKSLPPSISKEENPAMSFVVHGGKMTSMVHTGSGEHKIVTDSGRMYIADHQTFVTEQNEDFSFQRPVGTCLGQAPYFAPELFIGRSFELGQMADVLHPGYEPLEQRRLVLGGIGGIGKTQLAIAYAKSHCKIYDSVLWLNAASEASLNDSFQSIASHIFNAPNLGLDGKEIVRRIHQWLSDPKNFGWLLIFDNYDNPSQFKIDRYYPPASHGTIIVTSRRSDLVAGSNVQIKPFKNIKEGLDILQTRSKRENILIDPYAKRLAERLSGLPLALATAGTYLQRSAFFFERYLEEYEKRWNIDPRRPTKLQEYQERTLYTTWDLSYDRLEIEDLEAAKFMKLLAYFGNESIWRGLFYAGLADSSPEWLRQVITDDVNFDGVMKTLTEYQFLELHPKLESWSMHNCVHDWALAALNKNIDTQYYWYAFDCVNASTKGVDNDSFGNISYSRLAVHATQLVNRRFLQGDIIFSSTSERLDMFSRIARLLQDQIQLAAAEQMYLQVLAGKEKTLGAEHISTLDTVNSLGNLYCDQNKLDKAEQIYLRALAGKEITLGAEHISTLDTVNNLGLLYHEQGKLDEAKEMYDRAMAGYEKDSKEFHISILRTFNNLGLLYHDHGRLGEAEKMYNQALEGYEKALGADHKLTLHTVNNLGTLYSQQDKLSEAEQMFNRVLSGYKKALRTDHTLTLDAVNNLGALYHSQGKFSEAEEMYNRALAGKERWLGGEHTSTLQTVNNLGALYDEQGKLEEAEKMYNRSLTGKEKRLGAKHTSTLQTVNNLGVLYYNQGKLAEAEQMYNRALAGYKEQLGSDHRLTLGTVRNLDKLYRSQCMPAKEGQMYYRPLAWKEKRLFGTEHTSTIQTSNCGPLG